QSFTRKETKNMKKIIAGILLTSLVHNGFAQQANNELRNLINGSFTYYPRFKELEQAVQVSEQRVELAALGNKPNVSASGSYTYVAPAPTIPFPDGNGGVKDFKLTPNHNVSSAITV